jgi:hypothetical protein
MGSSASLPEMGFELETIQYKHFETFFEFYNFGLLIFI